ncbi:glycosyltransferase family 2 protein [Pseudoteredinibacter isoporae]|uniref:Cellulose synthase/poly-beta-1,6-N-acetylglucosamine synthase-like glycosyltransferase n=1 Tax=Pseudoteredinibacter isoporae TaxID=570281 RepID=A0A7X0JXU0_9GAMM|nr:glycosyltransferase [Pseudoteredinibacter isoporae]MBB6523673.1 cellulose synthase/poly-beta-1,6-N-acetylglucosamine synthase-like glycosyltransferase [Pseudoteredinibacter isoporae]
MLSSIEFWIQNTYWNFFNQLPNMMFIPMLVLLELPLMIMGIVGCLRWYQKRYLQEQAEALNSASVFPRRTPKVSCIITCYAEGDAIIKTIDTLAEQVYDGNIEIIAVVDGASVNADTYAAALSCRAGFAQYENREFVILPKWQRGGRVSTLNAGLANSTGDIVINVDGDTSFDNTMVREMVRLFDDPNVPAAGGALRARNHSDNLLCKMQGIEYLLSMQTIKNGLAEWNLLNNISGAFGAFRRDFLRHIGGWDTHTAEDLDLTVRIKTYFQRHPNLRLGFAPLAVGHTDVPASFKDLLMQRLRWDGDLLFLYLRKHYKSLSPDLMGTKSFIYTLIYGVGQNVVLPIVVLLYTIWLLVSYPIVFFIALMAFLYGLYVFTAGLLFIVHMVLISERPKEDVWFILYLPLFPLYTMLMRFWCVFCLLNEVLRRGHEESSMAPWWVLKRGHKF